MLEAITSGEVSAGLAQRRLITRCQGATHFDALWAAGSSRVGSIVIPKRAKWLKVGVAKAILELHQTLAAPDHLRLGQA